MSSCRNTVFLTSSVVKHLLSHMIVAIEQVLMIRQYDRHVPCSHDRQEDAFDQYRQSEEHRHSQHADAAAECDVERHRARAVVVVAPQRSGYGDVRG